MLSEIFPAVNARQVAMHYRQKLTYDASHHVLKDNASIPTGTMVMLRDELRSNKNDPPYLGPYRITGRNIRGAYDLVDSVGGAYHRDVCIDRMKIIRSSIPLEDNPKALDITWIPCWITVWTLINTLICIWYVGLVLTQLQIRGSQQR